MYFFRRLFYYLLLPFAWLYGRIVRARNWLYDKEVMAVTRFDLPLIGIGNLSAGGTGKTPMAEYLLTLLQENEYRTSLLSRGYKRRTKGFQIVRAFATALDVGDEPYQVKKKFPDTLVVVCEDRVEGIRRIRQNHTDVDAVVLDDCLQHRSLKPGFNILLTDYARPYFRDKLLPAGMLREPIQGRFRADLIVVTKCPPGLTPSNKAEFIEKLKPGVGQDVYFTAINYNSIRNMSSDGREEVYPVEFLHGYEIVLFTGIAFPDPLLMFLNTISKVVKFIRFSDHHVYKEADIQKIRTEFSQVIHYNKLILTTEKDFRRLEGTPEMAFFERLPVYFLTISVDWDEDEKRRFDEKILTYVRNHREGSRPDQEGNRF
jgi:tetraacyldisaccharide 4'-kinase